LPESIPHDPKHTRPKCICGTVLIDFGFASKDILADFETPPGGTTYPLVGHEYFKPVMLS
jgi:hypothetical protein